MMNAKPTITTTDWTRNDGAQSTLKQPTLNELLAITFEERQYSRPPQLIWLCMGGYRRSRFAAPHMSAFVQVFGRRQSRALPRADAAGVRKAPRHEIAVGGAPALQRALWGFDYGVGLQKVGPTSLLVLLCPEAWVCGHA